MDKGYGINGKFTDVHIPSCSTCSILECPGMQVWIQRLRSTDGWMEIETGWKNWDDAILKYLKLNFCLRIIQWRWFFWCLRLWYLRFGGHPLLLLLLRHSTCLPSSHRLWCPTICALSSSEGSSKLKPSFQWLMGLFNRLFHILIQELSLLHYRSSSP